MQMLLSVKKPSSAPDAAAITLSPGYGGGPEITAIASPPALAGRTGSSPSRRRVGWSGHRPDVAGRCFDLLNVDVGIEDDRERVVRRVPDRQAVHAPVKGKSALKHSVLSHLERSEPFGHHYSRRDPAPSRDDLRPSTVLELAHRGQFRHDCEPRLPGVRSQSPLVLPLVASLG